MNAANTAPVEDKPAHGRHQTLTIVLHWVTTLLVLTQFVLAVVHVRVSDAEMRRGALEAHRWLGVVIWVLVMGRLAWRLIGMRLLPFPPGMPRWHQWGARSSEWALYGLLCAQPLTGIATAVLGGRPFDLFGMHVTAQGLHTLGAYGLASLVLVHAGAAILHRVIADDGVLDSMLPAARKRGSMRIEPLTQTE